MTKEEFQENFLKEGKKTFNWQKLNISYSDEISNLLLEHIKNTPSSLEEENKIENWNTLFYLITGIRVEGNKKFLTKLNESGIDLLKEKYFSKIDVEEDSWLEKIMEKCFELEDNKKTIVEILNMKKLNIETKKEYIKKNLKQIIKINKEILDHVYDDRVKSIIKDVVIQYDENENNYFQKNNLFKIEIKQGSDHQYIYDFIFELNLYYKKYLDKWKKENEEWNTFWNKTNQNNKSISREEEFAKSPLTILHGPWGSGKTFFIKELIKKWDTLVQGLKLGFKNIIYIDLSQHFYGNTDVVLEFTQIFYEIVLKFLPKKEKIIENLKKTGKSLGKLFYEFLKKCLPIQFKNFISFFSDQIENIKNEYDPFSELSFDYKEKQAIKFEVQKIVKKIKPTIVVLDNIERLENSILDIIKIIRFYSYFSNFLFILPMNKSVIKFGDFVNIPNEDPIDKFNTLGVWFHYKQNYIPLLRRCEILDDAVHKINEILNQPKIDKKTKAETVLSIRELEKLLDIYYDSINLLTKYPTINRYDFYWLFDKKIWPNDLILNEIKWCIKYIFDKKKRDNDKTGLLLPNDPIFNNIIEHDENYHKVVDWFNEFLLIPRNINNKQTAMEQGPNSIDHLKKELHRYIYDKIETKYNWIISSNPNYEQLLNEFGIPNNVVSQITYTLMETQLDENNNRYFLSNERLRELLNEHYNNYNWDEEWVQKKYNFYWLFDKKIWPNDLILNEIKWCIEYISNYPAALSIKKLLDILRNIRECSEVVDWFNKFFRKYRWWNPISKETNWQDILSTVLHEFIYNNIEARYNQIINRNEPTE